MIRIIIISFISLYCWSTFAQTMTSTQIYDKAVDLTSKNFYDQTFRGLDWPQLAQQYRRRISGQSSLKELKIVLNDLLQNLNASHTEFITADEQEYHGLQSIFSRRIDGDQIFQCGGWYKNIGQKWFVKNVFANSPMARSGMVAGDEIVAVDGKPFAEIQSCNTSLPVVFKYRRSPNAAVQTVTITPVLKSAQELLLEATNASEAIWNIGGKRVGYFHLWSGTDDLFLLSLQGAVGRMAKTTDAMILDLRDGFGGAWTPYIQQFFDTDLDTGEPTTQVYSKPVYVLINGGVRSGKEYLAFEFKEKKRALLIGTNTAGHFLGGQLFDLDSGSSSLYLAVAGDPTGALEGRGVAPDIFIDNPVQYSEGADRQLEKVLELIENHSFQKKGL